MRTILPSPEATLSAQISGEGLAATIKQARYRPEVAGALILAVYTLSSTLEQTSPKAYAAFKPMNFIVDWLKIPPHMAASQLRALSQDTKCPALQLDTEKFQWQANPTHPDVITITNAAEGIDDNSHISDIKELRVAIEKAGIRQGHIE